MYRQAHYRALPGAGPKRAEKIAPIASNCIPKRLRSGAHIHIHICMKRHKILIHRNI
jgi:hypothetical protein